MKTINVDLYEYSELSDKAKERARDWYRGGYELDDSAVLEDFATIARILGFEFETHTVKTMGGKELQEPNIWYEKLHCQGERAGFDARYSYGLDSVRKLHEYAPDDTELHRIARELLELQKRFRYKLTANVRFDREWDTTEYDANGVEYSGLLREHVRALGNWLVRALRSELEYQTSDKAIADAIEANEYAFTIDGQHFAERRADNMSWYGYVTAAKGQMLLGGVAHHKSSRFETREQASDWTATAVKINCEAGRMPSAWGQVQSNLAPQIRAHETGHSTEGE